MHTLVTAILPWICLFVCLFILLFDEQQQQQCALHWFRSGLLAHFNAFPTMFNGIHFPVSSLQMYTIVYYYNGNFLCESMTTKFRVACRCRTGTRVFATRQTKTPQRRMCIAFLCIHCQTMETMYDCCCYMGDLFECVCARQDTHIFGKEHSHGW